MALALNAGRGLTDEEFINSLDDGTSDDMARVVDIYNSLVNPLEDECITGGDLDTLNWKRDEILRLCDELESNAGVLDENYPVEMAKKIADAVRAMPDGTH